MNKRKYRTLDEIELEYFINTHWFYDKVGNPNLHKPNFYIFQQATDYAGTYFERSEFEIIEVENEHNYTTHVSCHTKSR